MKWLRANLDRNRAPRWRTFAGLVLGLLLIGTVVPSGGVDLREPTAEAADTSLIRVDAGGGTYTDRGGRAWAADRGFSIHAGWGKNAVPIAGTEDDRLYQSERYGANFTYGLVVPNGSYAVTLKFAETFFNARGRRVFDVAIEGQTVLRGLDIFAEVGRNAALDKTFTVNVGDGNLNIAFAATVDSAQVTAIEVLATGGGGATPVAGPDTTALAGCLNGSFGAYGPPGAFELPVEQKDELQIALDLYRIVRLQAADYRLSLPEVTLRSGQQLYGIPGTGVTRVPPIVTQSGATGVVLSGVQVDSLVFPASTAATRGNCYVMVAGHDLRATGATLEDNLFLGLQSQIDIDTRAGGSLRNNRFIRVRGGQADLPALRVRGDGGRASGGNVWLWYNALTPHGESLYFENQADATLVGIDAEAWNQYGLSSSPLLKTGPMGTLRVLRPNGGQNTADAYQSGTYDIAADEFQVFNATISSRRTPDVILRAQNKRTAMLAYQPQSTADEASGALRLRAFENAFWPSSLVADAFVDGRSVTQGAPAAAQQDALRRMFVAPGRPGVPWERPAFGPIPDPAGPGWSADLASKPDATDYLQGLIDAQGIARVPAGLYHISRPLRLKAGQGLLGAGDTRTAIIAKSPALDMLVGDVHCDGESICPTKFSLHGVTLQGGRNGIHWDAHATGRSAQIHDSLISHVTFRDMAEAGIFVDGIMGWDNNTLLHVNFYRNGTGIKQRSSWSGGGEPGQSYIDKVVFFHSQFVENGRGLDLQARRQNHANAWINTLFRDNAEHAAYFTSSTGTIFANSDFINNGGDPVISSNYHPACVSCYFRADGRGVAMLSENSTCEGCVFERGSSSRATVMSGTDLGEPSLGFFYNSRSNDMPVGRVQGGAFFNNSFASDSRLSEQGVLLKDGRTYTIVSGEASPTPQLLVGSVFR